MIRRFVSNYSKKSHHDFPKIVRRKSGDSWHFLRGIRNCQFPTTELFHPLLVLYDALVAFAQAGHLIICELNPNVHHDLDSRLELLEALTAVFVAAQKDVESNDVAAGSHSSFIIFLPVSMQSANLLRWSRTRCSGSRLHC
jgi:hypothetical protein